jgi:HK97 gp10 family phage protein
MSGTVKTTIIGLGELQAQFKRISKAARGAALAKAGTSGLLLVQNAAIPKAPKLTGTLRRSIHTEVLEQRDDYAEVAVGTDVIYAAIQEFGGVITPKKAKMLHWVGEGGVDIFAKSVTIKPHPYLLPAWDENESKMINEVKTSLAQLIEKAAAG